MTWTLPTRGPGADAYIDLPVGCWPLSVIDEGPRHAPPDRRYKAAWYEERGMCVAFSADGVRLQRHDANLVIPSHLPGDTTNIVNDILDVRFDPLRRRHLLGCTIEKGGFPGKPRHHRPGFRRCVGLGVSEDFVTWSRPGIIVTPDPRHGLAEFYGFTPTVRGNLYLGFLRVLRDDLPATPGGAVEGVGWTELTSSRDGKTWTRHQERFLDRGGPLGGRGWRGRSAIPTGRPVSPEFFLRDAELSAFDFTPQPECDRRFSADRQSLHHSRGGLC